MANKKVKILWVNPSFLDYRIPLYKNLHILSQNNFVILYSKNRVPERIIVKTEAELGVDAVGLSNEKTINLGKGGDFANQGLSIPFQKGLYKEINNATPDIIISEGFFQWTPFAILYGIIHGKPVWIAYERTKHTERNCPKWRAFYRKFINLFVKGYLVNGVLTETYLKSIGIQNKPILKGCMSAETEGLAKRVSCFADQEQNNLKQQINLKGGITFLFCGRLIELKGVKELLCSWIEHIIVHPQDNLLIVGEGILLNELENKYKKEHSISFIGSVDYDTIHTYYAIADVFILPTLEDNWSLVIPEAMACGLPVATSYYNGCYPELVKKDINGFVFDPLDSASLLEAFQYFHNHIDELKVFGKNSIEINSHYTSKLVAERIFNFVVSH